MLVKVTGWYFVKNYVMYSSIIGRERFASLHKRDGLTDEQAKTAFYPNHCKEVEILLLQKERRENN